MVQRQKSQIEEAILRHDNMSDIVKHSETETFDFYLRHDIMRPDRSIKNNYDFIKQFTFLDKKVFNSCISSVKLWTGKKSLPGDLEGFQWDLRPQRMCCAFIPSLVPDFRKNRLKHAFMGGGQKR